MSFIKSGHRSGNPGLLATLFKVLVGFFVEFKLFQHSQMGENPKGK